VVRAVNQDEWSAVRELRLRALADAPDAFAETLADAEALTDEGWMERLAPCTERQWFVEESVRGDLVGMAIGFYDGRSSAYLGGMWVDPQHRGSGIGRRLVDAVEKWAQALGATMIELEVNPAVAAATNFYARCGYEPTGNSRPLPGHPGSIAVEMHRRL
jgi:GNAT superfamily N-acetyltransferase